MTCPNPGAVTETDMSAVGVEVRATASDYSPVTLKGCAISNTPIFPAFVAILASAGVSRVWSSVKFVFL